MNNSFATALKQGLTREEKIRDKFYITDIGKACDGCMRCLYLDFQHAPKADLGVGKLLMFEHGNRIHDTINEFLLQSELFKNVIAEQRCELNIDGHVFSGRYDCKAEVEGKEVIIDYKTVRGAAFQHLDEPKESHAAQVMAYLMALNLYEGHVVYIDREGQNGFRIFGIGRDDEYVISLARKCIKAKETQANILKPIYKKEELKTKINYYVSCPWQCSYCDYYGISCDGAMPKELDIGKAWAAEKKGGELNIKEGFEPYFKDMEKFNV
ncbi:MAG: PD-(D/E)XK nuclease family protein [Firmicutes bacterium]|nr:PD-(D/E)XK nuclease family protein [Bacillota bacterium]